MSWQEYCNQASQLVNQGRYKEAELIILEAFKEARETRDLQRVYTSLDLLGWLAFVQHKHADAEKVYQHVVNVKAQLFGRDHVEVAKTLKNLIAASYQLKAYDRVVHYASEAARIYSGNLGSHHPECQQIAKNLYELLRWMGRASEAEAIRQRYLTPAPPPPIVAQNASMQAPHAVPVAQVRGSEQTRQVSSGGVAQNAQPVQAQAQAYRAVAPAENRAPAAHPGQAQGSHAQQHHIPGSRQAQAPASGHSSALPAANVPRTQGQSSAAYSSGYAQPLNKATAAANQPSAVNQPNVVNQPNAANHIGQARPHPPASQGASSVAGGGEAPVRAEQSQSGKRDYRKFAKNICDVCQSPFEGSACLRCTSGQIAAFDPDSRLSW